MMTRRISLIVALACVPSMAWAQAPSSAAGQPPARHQGLFFRLAPGVGTLGASTGSGSEAKVSGSAGSFTLALGTSVASRTVLGGELTSFSVAGPTLEQYGASADSSDGVTWSVHFIGAHISHYFPSNLYLTGAVGAAFMKLETPYGAGETNTGVGLSVAVGKEWWVSQKWGIGGALRAFSASIPDQGDVSWSTLGFGLSLSASYH